MTLPDVWNKSVVYTINLMYNRCSFHNPFCGLLKTKWFTGHDRNKTRATQLTLQKKGRDAVAD